MPLPFERGCGGFSWSGLFQREVMFVVQVVTHFVLKG